MSNAHELSRSHKQFHKLIEFALQHGWEIVCTPGGQLKFTKPDLPPIYTGSTASDHHKDCTTRTHLQRVARRAGPQGGTFHA